MEHEPELSALQYPGTEILPEESTIGQATDILMHKSREGFRGQRIALLLKVGDS